MSFERTASALLRSVEQLRLTIRGYALGHSKSLWPSRDRGDGIDFRDHKAYLPGDPLRAIDINAYRRLGRLYTRRFSVERDTSFYIIVDNSASMELGNPSKLAFAAHIAIILCFLALRAQGRVTLIGCSDRIESVTGPFRGASSLIEFAESLESLKAYGRTDLREALSIYLSRASRGGVVVVLSDLLDLITPIETAYQLLCGKKNDATFLHILAPDDVEPHLRGFVKLVDVESHETLVMQMDERVAAECRQTILAYLKDVSTGATRYQHRHIVLRSDTPLPIAVHRELRRNGWL